MAALYGFERGWGGSGFEQVHVGLLRDRHSDFYILRANPSTGLYMLKILVFRVDVRYKGFVLMVLTDFYISFSWSCLG